MQNKTDKIASKLLGKKIEGSTNYDPSLLVPIPRIENRQKYNIDEENLPFDGWDIWHAYEFSAMTENNLPVTRVLKLKYPANSPFIIESKSLKLYLNSFNMSNFGKNTGECLSICRKIISEDLSKSLSTDVKANFLLANSNPIKILQKFTNIMNFVDQKTLKISEFKEAPQVLKVISTEETTGHFLRFDSLRSNCRVTHQPDFGDAFIYYESKNKIDYESLLKYLVSFRSEYHFHEECIEMIYKRLHDLLNPNDKLFVCALYTRRGGIDITPLRFSKGFSSEDIYNLLDMTTFSRFGIKQ